MEYAIRRSSDASKTYDRYGRKKLLPSPCDQAYLSEDGTQWMITIDTLEQLRNFIDEEGRLIISEQTIEIYDGWRE